MGMETGIIVSGMSWLACVPRDDPVGDCLIFIIPSLGNIGLFSVPAPSQHPRVFDGVFYWNNWIRIDN
jgi:hypothetical protein